MTEENWTSEANDPPPAKKGLPKWLWFLGCGCLTIVLLTAIGGGLLWKSVQGVADPEVQWPALAQVLPFEERPDLNIAKMPFVDLTPGIDQMWVLMIDGSANTATVYSLSGESGLEIRDGLLSTEGEVDLPFVGGVHNMTVTTVMVQGRELDAVRFTSFDPDEEGADEEQAGEGGMNEMQQALRKAVMRVDVTPESAESGYVLIEYAKAGTLEAVTEEEIADFLAPFLIGPDR